jgi:TPR repeat protein
VALQRYREGDYATAFEHLAKTAETGDIESHFKLSVMYRTGHGVVKDKKKEKYHLEAAAIGGHLGARYNLAIDAVQ